MTAPDRGATYQIALCFDGVVHTKRLVPGLGGLLSTLLGHSASHSERLFLPHTCRSRYTSGPAQSGVKTVLLDPGTVDTSAPEGQVGLRAGLLSTLRIRSRRWTTEDRINFGRFASLAISAGIDDLSCPVNQKVRLAYLRDSSANG